MNTVDKLKDMLVRHDWWYAYSDSQSAWRAGQQNWKNILEVAEELGRVDIVNAAVKALDNGENIAEVIKEM